jgi:uncharacterized membrane protein YeiH
VRFGVPLRDQRYNGIDCRRSIGGAVTVYGDQTQLILDLLGVFFFAITGALLAARKGFDIVASYLLASMTGLGGGAIRDLAIGDTPPAALADPVYLAPPAVATFVVFFFFTNVSRFRRTLLTFDAAGLGLFSVTGTVKALGFGVTPVAAIALGVVSAIGGGLLRDVVAREVPSVFRHDDIYALPAVIGAVGAAVLWEIGWMTIVGGIAASLVTFLFRMSALRYGWRAPLAYRRRAEA